LEHLLLCNRGAKYFSISTFTQGNAMSESASSSLPKRRIFQGLAAITTLALLGKAAAQPRGERGGDSAGMIERRIDHMIKSVNGTPEQKAKLTALAQAAMADMKPLREQHMTARKKGMELLAAPTIDRGALEQLRAQQMQLADSMSRRMLAQMSDAAEVLTPAQRTQLAEKMKSHSERGGHGSRGGMHGGGWFR
jgi:periplasmic protein CpxP/Spy